MNKTRLENLIKKLTLRLNPKSMLVGKCGLGKQGVERKIKRYRIIACIGTDY